MEKNDQLALHRSRSIRGIVRDGYRLYGKYFYRVLRSSWIQATGYALATGLSMAYFFTYLLPPLMESRLPSAKLTTWLLTLAAFIVMALLLAFAGGVAPLHEHSLTDSISHPHRWWGRWPWRLTVKGLKRLPAMLWATLRRGQAGALIVAALILLLLVLISTAVLQMPALIMAIANFEAAAGMAAGDAVDMPENLFLLNFATFGICGFLQAYIHLSTLFPLYYIWGNACEKTRKQPTEEQK